VKFLWIIWRVYIKSTRNGSRYILPRMFW